MGEKKIETERKIDREGKRKNRQAEKKEIEKDK